MRAIGQLESEQQARTLADYLFLRDIEAQIESAAGGQWTVWVIDEDRVDESRALLSRFRSMPDAEEFYQATGAAEERRRGVRQEARVEQQKLKRREVFPWQLGGGGFTLVLLVFCVGAALVTRLGQNPVWTGWLQFLPAEVLRGQVWRLLTPVFLHFTLWGLFVNLLWIQDLGTALEGRIGTWRFALLVALVALISNLAQYAAGGGLPFVGMNGVVYGMFGYLWIRGRRDFNFGLAIAPLTSGLLLVFLALGIFGLLGPTANAAHFSGLLAGGVLGWLDSLGAARKA